MNFRTLLAALCLLCAQAGQADVEIVDQVVAIVDDDVIMASELRDRLGAVNQALEARGIEPPPEDELIRETLDRLILDSIQLQKGTRVGVRISDDQINAAVERIAAQNGMSIDEFRQALEAQGQSYVEMREQLRREMIIQRVQAGNVNQRIQISEQEVNNFLSTAEGQKLAQPEFRVLHALLPVSPEASDAELAGAEQRVQQVLQRIRGGTDFETAVKGSDPPYTFGGGDLGWRKLEDLPSLLADVVPGLEQGETADPIRSDSGFHLVLLAGKRGGEQMVAQTKVRHILIKPSEIMTEEEARQLAADLRRRALAGEDFGDLAREYSEDIGSAAEGGELGWTLPGQMVPEFEAAIAKTEEGDVSEPVRTQFGWHILKVEGRREQDMTDEAVRNRARNYLHERKYQEELDAWLRQIRDEAFVDIK